MSNEKSRKRKNLFFQFLKGIVRLIYPKYSIEGMENLPDEPAVIVGNHSKANGPIALQLYSPRESYTWCTSHMMHLKEVPGYAFEDFWSKKPKCTLWIYKILSYVIAPLAVFIMNHANTIGVYRDKRILYTFRESIERMQEGADVVVFPECYEEHNNIVHAFQRGFVELARLDYKKTKRSTPFVPMYVCPALKKLVFGKPIYYNATANTKEEAERICNELMDAISEMAYSLPRHKVVTYNNIRKKFYPENVRKVEKETI